MHFRPAGPSRFSCPTSQFDFVKVYGNMVHQFMDGESQEHVRVVSVKHFERVLLRHHLTFIDETRQLAVRWLNLITIIYMTISSQN